VFFLITLFLRVANLYVVTFSSPEESNTQFPNVVRCYTIATMYNIITNVSERIHCKLMPCSRLQTSMFSDLMPNILSIFRYFINYFHQTGM